MSAPNMSLSTGFSPKPLGMIFSRRRSSTNSRSSKLRIGRDLRCEVAHPMRQTTLARRAGEAFVDRPDDPQARRR